MLSLRQNKKIIIEINNKHLRENSTTVPFKWTVIVRLISPERCTLKRIRSNCKGSKFVKRGKIQKN